MIRLRNGLGWVDAASGWCALPPDGEVFAIAPKVSPTFRALHVVEVPRPIAVVSVGPAAPLIAGEAARIREVLGGHVDHVAFLSAEGVGTGVVEGEGPPFVLAIAAAALKAIGGWDESDLFVFTVNRRRVEVRLRLVEGAWEADAKEVGEGDG